MRTPAVILFCLIILVFLTVKNLLNQHKRIRNDPSNNHNSIFDQYKNFLYQKHNSFKEHHGGKRKFTSRSTTKDPRNPRNNIRNNHTMLKVDYKEVVDMINHMKNIDIDRNQLEIYNKYQERKKEMADKDNANQGDIYAGFYSGKRLSPDEQDKRLRGRLNVVHPHPFPYIINSPKICANQSVFLVIYVHTSLENYHRREVIRRTWGNCAYYAQDYDTSVKIVFVMGQKNYTDQKKKRLLQQTLELEQEAYGDLVQEDFIDTYHNLTYKGVAALKWISLYCPQATFVLKTDDDIFVNMYTLLNHLKKLEKDDRNMKGLILCAVWYNMSVLRKGKWKVLKEEWASSVYPTYCSGSAFVLSTDVALILHEVSYYVPFFWVDDFYITGLLPLKAGNIVHRQFHSTYVLNGDLLEAYFTGPQWQSYVFSHLKELNRIIKVWNKMTRLAKREEVAKIKTSLPGELN